jgi:hypothetical protein
MPAVSDAKPFWTTYALKKRKGFLFYDFEEWKKNTQQSDEAINSSTLTGADKDLYDLEDNQSTSNQNQKEEEEEEEEEEDSVEDSEEEEGKIKREKNQKKKLKKIRQKKKEKIEGELAQVLEKKIPRKSPQKLPVVETGSTPEKSLPVSRVIQITGIAPHARSVEVSEYFSSCGVVESVTNPKIFNGICVCWVKFQSPMQASVAMQTYEKK